MRRPDRVTAAYRALLLARTAIEALSFAVVVSAFHLVDPPRFGLPLLPTALALWGAGLMLASWMRTQLSARTGAALAASVAAVFAAFGVSVASPEGSGLGVLVRVIGFAIIAEAFLWRFLSIARDPSMWHEAVNALSVAALCLGLAAILPAPFDHGPIAILALALVILGGFTLSLARAAEELRDSNANLRTAAARSGASVTTVVLGVVAVIAAFLEPRIQDALEPVWRLLGDVAVEIIILIVTPIAYLAAIIATFVMERLPVGRVGDLLQVLDNPYKLTEDELGRAAADSLQPWIFGAFALLVAIIALVIGIVLVDRLVREKRYLLPAGATLDRESVAGLGLFDALRALRPGGPPARRAPRDDGSPAAAVRLLYWRFLALAEERGAGWRKEPETTREHARRIAAADPRWTDAGPIVAAFNDLRYGEREPETAAIAAAREALARVRRATEPEKD